MTSNLDSNTDETQLLFALGYCVFILLLFIVVQRFPPKKINWFYGYRTRRSMANQEIWDRANLHSIKTVIRLCLYSFMVPVFFYFIYPEINFVATVLVNTLLIIVSVILTENHLNEHFDKNGNPK